MSEWQDMQQKPNTKLQGLLKTKQAKTRKLCEGSNADPADYVIEKTFVG